MIEDKLVHSDNIENPLEEFKNAEELVVSSCDYVKRKGTKVLDIYTCPNLCTNIPVMKVYTYMSVKEYEKLEDKDFIIMEVMKEDIVRVVSYFSLAEARYISVVNIKGQLLFSNYRLSKEELTLLKHSLASPSKFPYCRTTYEEMIRKINLFFNEDEGSDKSISYYNKNNDLDLIARSYHLSKNKLARPFYKNYPFKDKVIPNYIKLESRWKGGKK